MKSARYPVTLLVMGYYELFVGGCQWCWNSLIGSVFGVSRAPYLSATEPNVDGSYKASVIETVYCPASESGNSQSLGERRYGDAEYKRTEFLGGKGRRILVSSRRVATN